jgi:hypothetical protein
MFLRNRIHVVYSALGEKTVQHFLIPSHNRVKPIRSEQVDTGEVTLVNRGVYYAVNLANNWDAL